MYYYVYTKPDLISIGFNNVETHNNGIDVYYYCILQDIVFDFDVMINAQNVFSSYEDMKAREYEIVF